MNGIIDTGIMLSNRDTGHPDRAEQARRLLMLLMETERAIYRDPDIASTYLNQAISLLTVTKHNKQNPCRPRGGLASWQISRVDKFITDNISSSIRTIELASLLRLSVSHFTHAFKQTTGTTPLIYIATIRIKAAQQFMLCSTHSLSDIALSHGFCDQAHFCRVFRRETGLSPQTWRRLYASNA
ncbi:AraC family transcriptional regulator [Pseudomonas sp. GD03944]|uniref:AraC family transcriptional regulator n=1 Tax=Pseudomonas sp. GD03944 TaxID=2975409 RepID=UPI0024484467|nr:AraC family transcriptional regulator [Pseudomonas sp. GD03944]MDH1262059.1 AraC family transcriptional regulator [Pseudomonas sp. GD03944]